MSGNRGKRKADSWESAFSFELQKVRLQPEATAAVGHCAEQSRSKQQERGRLGGSVAIDGESVDGHAIATKLVDSVEVEERDVG